MRKEIIIDIVDNGSPLRFKVRQMPATRHHKFILKLVLLASRSGLAAELAKKYKEADVKKDDTRENEVKEADLDLNQIDMKKMDVVGLLERVGALDYDSVEPLLYELLGCCSRVVDGMDMPCTPETIDGYVEDVRTIFRLEMEAAKINFSFFQGGVISQDSKAKADITISKRTKI